MPKLHILIAPPAAGKSTLVAQWLKEQPNLVCISRDSLRQMLRHEWTPAKAIEDLITQLTLPMIRQALLEGLDVVVDNTHCEWKYIQPYYSHFSGIATIHLEIQKTDLATCLLQDATREKAVGEKVVRKFWDKYVKLQKQLDTEIQPQDFITTPYLQNKELPAAIIVDIDGTIANFEGHRLAFHYKRVYKDLVIEPVAHILRLIQQENTTRIIFFSGREDVCYEDTCRWLTDKAGINNPELYMRKEKDHRSDSIVKKELFQAHIENKYTVLFAIDDRKSIKNLWRTMGIFVLDVNQQDYWF